MTSLKELKPRPPISVQLSSAPASGRTKDQIVGGLRHRLHPVDDDGADVQRGQVDLFHVTPLPDSAAS